MGLQAKMFHIISLMVVWAVIKHGLESLTKQFVIVNGLSLFTWVQFLPNNYETFTNVETFVEEFKEKHDNLYLLFIVIMEVNLKISL